MCSCRAAYVNVRRYIFDGHAVLEHLPEELALRDHRDPRVALRLRTEVAVRRRGCGDRKGLGFHERKRLALVGDK